MKVIAEFTEKGFKVALLDKEGKIISEEHHAQSHKFGIECVRGNFEADEKLTDKMYSALDNIRDAAVDVMDALKQQRKK